MPYTLHENFEQYSNPSEVTVWRYMSLKQLLCIIKHQTLRFAKITEWDDLIEGYAEPFTIETLSKELNVRILPIKYIFNSLTVTASFA